MRLPRMDPDTAYLSTSLYLPARKLGSVEAVLNALTIQTDTEERVLYTRHPHHLEVPRNFMRESDLKKAAIPVVDLRPTEFERIDMRERPGFALRPNQIDAWRKLEAAVDEGRDGILQLDTGGGKTVLGLRAICRKGGPALIVSAQEAHLKNWEIEINQFFDLRGQVGWILRNKLEHDRPIVMSTVQTLVKKVEAGLIPADFFRRFAITIYDEVHHQAAAWFSVASDLSTGQRLGLTATLNRKDRCESVVLYHVGPLIFKDPGTHKLVPEVVVHDSGIEVPEKSKEVRGRGQHPHAGLLRNYLGGLEQRNNLIVRIVKQRSEAGHKIYLATHSVDHAYLLERLLVAKGLNAAAFTGLTSSAEERLRILRESDVVIVSVLVGKENYNRTDLSCLVLATPLPADSHAPTEFVQLVGRILRPMPGKKPVVDLIRDKNGLSRGLTESCIKWCRANKWVVKNPEDAAWQRALKQRSQRKSRP